MPTDPLFDIPAPPTPNPMGTIRNGHWTPNQERLKYAHTPRPTHCPTCHLIILTVLADDREETTLDPTTLTPEAAKAAHILNIPTYRAPHPPSGPPECYWARWVTPTLDTWNPHREYLSPPHRCGTLPLPGHPIPIRPKPPADTTNLEPPY